jgi:pimeloyl-ACP methyl ester carboxylesterase
MDIETVSVELPQGSVTYRAAGPVQSTRPPVVFLHGILVDARLWDDVGQRLAAEGVRSYAPTLPLGAQPAPMRPDADLSPQGVARLALDLIAALGLGDVTIVGNDTGGAIAQLMLAADASRIGAVVLTNCDAYRTFPPRKLAPLFWVLRHPGLVGGLARQLRSNRIRQGRLAYGPLSRDTLDPGLTADWVRPLSDPAVRRDLAQFARGVHPDLLLDAATRFSQFAGPVRVLWGEADPMFPVALGRQLGEEFPQASVTTIPDGRVFLPLDYPDEVAREITATTRDRSAR